MSQKSTENITSSDSSFAPTFVDHHVLRNINFNEYCLIKNNFSIPKVINLYMSYKSGLQLRNSNKYITLSNYLFGSVKLNKNPNIDKYRYTGYSIGTDSCSEFLFTDRSYGENFIIFGVHMSSSVHVDHKGKDILILDGGPTQGLDDTTLTAEAKYPINFTQSGKKICIKPAL